MHRSEYKEVHTFPKGVSIKVNAMAQLVFELAYNNITIQDVSHNAMGTLPSYKGMIYI